MKKCKIVPACEPQKSDSRRRENGFYDRFLTGKNVLDIGGGKNGSIIKNATVIDLDFAGYDGMHLPFDDESQDAVFSSHCLEHIEDPVSALKEWFRVIKKNGYLVLAVPHQYLYERKTSLPSNWNEEHLRFYTPASLLHEIESSLEFNTYRIRHLCDNDHNYDYTVSGYEHATGCYEIEVALEKLSNEPTVDIELSRLKQTLQKDNIKEIIICGAGKIGQDIKKMTDSIHIKTIAFTDKKTNKELESISLTESEKLVCPNYVVASVEFKNEILNEIKKLNKKNIKAYTI